MERFEEVLIDEHPDFVFGDINSTLAAPLATVKMGIEVLHVEVG